MSTATDTMTAEPEVPASDVGEGQAGQAEERERPDQREELPTTWVDRVEAFLSRLSTRDSFWNRIISFIFLPLAFWSGIRMKNLGGGEYSAVLPFKKFNKNWYNAMAGAALLANTEVAAGNYVFGTCGGEYTVVCKNLNYDFLRPCLGPAIYRMKSREPLNPLVEAGGEFNVTLDVDVRQQGFRPEERDKRVGRAEITFHVTPKSQFKKQKAKRKARDRQKKTLRKAGKL